MLHIQDPSEATEPIQLKYILAPVELKYILPRLARRLATSVSQLTHQWLGIALVS